MRRDVCRLLLVLLLPAGCFAQGAERQEPTITRDVVFFENGDRLTGTLTITTETDITFTTDFGLAIQIPRNKVKEIRRAQSFASTTKGQASGGAQSTPLSPEHYSIHTASGELSVNNAGGNTKVIQADVSQLSQAPDSSTRWLISIEPQASLMTGTQSQRVLGGQFILNRAQTRGANNWREQTTRLILGVNNTLTERPGAAPARLHVYDGTFTHQVKLGNHLSAFGIAEAYHNSALRLYLQQSYGGGLGIRKIFDQERQVVEVSSDVRFFGQHFYASTPADTFIGVRFGQGYTIRLYANKTKDRFIELFEKVNYMQPINLKNAWQIRGIAGIDVPISSSFTMRLQYVDDYFQNVPNGRKNYSRTTLGIRYAFTRPNS